MIYTDQGRHFVGVSSDIGSEKFVADQALLIFVKTVTTGALFCRDSQNVFLFANLLTFRCNFTWLNNAAVSQN